MDFLLLLFLKTTLQTHPAFAVMPLPSSILETETRIETDLKGMEVEGLFMGEEHCKCTGRVRYGLDNTEAVEAKLDYRCDGGIKGKLPREYQLCRIDSHLSCRPDHSDTHNFWSRQYEITARGLKVGERVIPWDPLPPKNIKTLLTALKEQVSYKLPTAESQQNAGKTPLRVECQSDVGTGKFSFLTVDMFYQKRLDLVNICSSSIYQKFLDTAHDGDTVRTDSPMGQCLTALLKGNKNTRPPCQVVKGTPYFYPNAHRDDQF